MRRRSTANRAGDLPRLFHGSTFRLSCDRLGGQQGEERFGEGYRWLSGLMLETGEILRSSVSAALQLFFAAMNTLGSMGLAGLIKLSLVPVLLAGLLAGAVSPCLAAEPEELALRRPARESRMVIDLSKRRITLVRGEQLSLIHI